MQGSRIGYAKRVKCGTRGTVDLPLILEQEKLIPEGNKTLGFILAPSMFKLSILV